MAEERIHAKLSPSASHRWLACPGSIRMSEGIPSATSVYAAEGTAAHSLAEGCLTAGINAVDNVGELFEGFAVDEEMAGAVQIYLDEVRAAYLTAGPAAELRVEHRFDLSWLYPGLFGTNDALVGQAFGKLSVFDYKHGAGVAVEVKDNPQLMIYGLGASHGDAYEDVELVIVQPRAYHSDGPVRRHTMPIKELLAWGHDVLLPGAIATEAPDAPLRAGEHCRFCPARAVCPEQRKQAQLVAKEVFAATPTNPPAPEALDFEELRRVLDAAPLVRSWLDACEVYVRNMLETGRVLPEEVGYKMVQGKASRRWSDEVIAEQLLKSLLGEDAYISKILSPAQAEKALGKDGKKQVEHLIESTRGVTMAPLSDKREAVLPAIAAFGEVEA